MCRLVFMSPVFEAAHKPFLRWADVPWVNESGTTTPRAFFWRLSSPMAFARRRASSMSPGSSDLNFCCRVIGPNAGEEIGLELEAHGELVTFPLTGAAAGSVNLFGDAEDFLHVVANFVGDDIGLGEVAGCAETLFHFAVKAEVEVHTFIFRTIEGTDGSTSETAGRVDPVGKQNELRVAIGGACWRKSSSQTTSVSRSTTFT